MTGTAAYHIQDRHMQRKEITASVQRGICHMRGPASRFANSHAVVVGVNAYHHGIPPLRNAVRDALEVGRALGVDHGFTVRGLLDEAATAPALRSLITEDLPSRIGSDDRLLVYIASHGITVASNTGPNGFLLLSDAIRDAPATFLAMQELHDGLAELRCRHLLLILDCCFAGTFRWAARRDIVLAKQVFRETFDRYVGSPAWQVVTSAASDQHALDVFGDRGDALGHSPFAAALLDGLAGEADADGDGLITATELYLHARARVELATDASALQTPGLFPLRRHERGEFVFQVPDRPLALPPAPVLTAELNPYRGLESFDEASQALFFGRERVVRELARAVLAQPLTAVVGPSGCGKSSVVKAGLVPLFRARQAATGPRRWSVIGPIRALDAALGRLADRELPEGNVLVVIDQLEELLTQSVGEPQRMAVLALLARWLARGGVRLVVTVRSDYEPELQRGDWSSAWRAGRFVVPPMTQDQLRRAIEDPAAARELYYKPASIVDDLINEVVQMPGALPLLSFTLSELYRSFFERHDDQRAITTQDVGAVGGTTRALTLRATSAVDELAARDPAFEITASHVMLRMIASSGAEPVRRRVPLRELVYADERETTRAAQLIHRFITARLLVAGSEPDGQAYVEPAHDGLIRGWDRVAAWRKQGEEHFAVMRALGAAASLWSVANDRRFLWHADPRLPQVVALRRSPSHPMNRLELAFVAASARRRRRRIASLTAIITAVITALSSITVVALRARNNATTQFERAERQRANALVGLAQTLGDPLQSALVLTEIGDEPPTAWQAAVVARRTAIQTIPMSVQRPTSNEIRELALHPSGHALLARDAGGGAWLMSVDGRGAPLALHGAAPVIDARFAHDGGPGLLTAAGDGSAALWSIGRRTVTAPLRGNGRSAIAWSLTGERAAIGYDDGTIRVFELGPGGTTASSFDHELPYGSGGLVLISADATRAISITPSGPARRLAVTAIALARGAQIAPLGELDLIPVPFSSETYIPRALLSDDGRRLVVYTRDFTQRTWDLDTMKLVVDGERGWRYPDAGDGSARCFAATFADGRAKVWGDCGDRSLVRSEAPPADELRIDPGLLFYTAPFAFAEHRAVGRHYALVGARDGSALLWRLDWGKPQATFLRRFVRHDSAVSALTIRPDQELVATASRDGEIRVWRMADPLAVDSIGPSLFSDGRHVLVSTFLGSAIGTVGDSAPPAKLPGPDRAWPYGAWFSPDGAHVAIAYDSARICSYSTQPVALERCCTMDGIPSSVVRSPDGARLWAGYSDGSATTCDLATGEASQLLASAEAAQGAPVGGFAPDATGVVVVQRNATLLHVGSGRRVVPVPTRGAILAATSEDGAMIATVTADGRVQVRRPSDGWQPHDLGRHLGEVTTLAFTSDGNRILSCTVGTVCDLWTVHTPGDKQMFWPRGRLAGMSRDGSLVITADQASFLVWSPAQPGAPIELGREDVQGTAAHAYFSPDGRRLVTIWSDRTGTAENVVTIQRLAIWRMNWREIVQGLRSSTTACLTPERRSALLGERLDEAQRAHELCMTRYGSGSPPAALAPPASPDPAPRPHRAAAPARRISLASGYVLRVTVDHDESSDEPPGVPGFTAYRVPRSADVAPMWDALVETVTRTGGVRLDVPAGATAAPPAPANGSNRFDAMWWTPVSLDVGRVDGYRSLVGAVHAESIPWEAPALRIVLDCESADHSQHIQMLSVLLAYRDLFDLDATRTAGRWVPSVELLDMLSYACSQVSKMYAQPLTAVAIRPFDGALPLPPGIIELAAQPRPLRTEPNVLAARIASVTGDPDKISPDVFARLFGHPPRSTSDGDGPE